MQRECFLTFEKDRPATLHSNLSVQRKKSNIIMPENFQNFGTDVFWVDCKVLVFNIVHRVQEACSALKFCLHSISHVSIVLTVCGVWFCAI